APGFGDLRRPAEIQPGGAARGAGIEAGGAGPRLQHLAMKMPRPVAGLLARGSAGEADRRGGAEGELAKRHDRSSFNGAPSTRAMIAAMRCQSSASRWSCLRALRARLLQSRRGVVFHAP